MRRGWRLAAVFIVLVIAIRCAGLGVVNVGSVVPPMPLKNTPETYGGTSAPRRSFTPTPSPTPRPTPTPASTDSGPEPLVPPPEPLPEPLVPPQSQSAVIGRTAGSPS